MPHVSPYRIFLSIVQNIGQIELYTNKTVEASLVVYLFLEHRRNLTTTLSHDTSYFLSKKK